MKKMFFLITLATAFCYGDLKNVGIVNVSTCLTESKYAKHEQQELEKVRSQWTAYMDETEKQLTEVNKKLEDQNYVDSLSPEAINELKLKQKNLNEEMSKYQNQFYQMANQANYAFMQKMFGILSKASEEVAKKNSLDVVINKEALFYTKSDLDITPLVLTQLDVQFDQEEKAKAEATSAAEKKETVPAEQAKPESKEQAKVEKPVLDKKAEVATLPQKPAPVKAEEPAQDKKAEVVTLPAKAAPIKVEKSAQDKKAEVVPLPAKAAEKPAKEKP